MDHIQKTVEDLIEKVTVQERELADSKRLVNLLLKQFGKPPHYAAVEPDPTEPAKLLGRWRNDEFYGQPLSTVVKLILQARKGAGEGAASVNDIYAVMTAHGFNFNCSNDENAKNSLRSSLRKNSAMFHRLPNGDYGLKEWYPNIKNKAKPADAPNGKEADAGGDELFDFDQREQEDNDVSSQRTTATNAA